MTTAKGADKHIKYGKCSVMLTVLLKHMKGYINIRCLRLSTLNKTCGKRSKQQAAIVRKQSDIVKSNTTEHTDKANRIN